jgi:hypothetical protein
VSPHGCDGSRYCELQWLYKMLKHQLAYKCTDERGGLFDLNKSSTWQKEGTYLLGLDTQLGFNGSGDYGLDALSFGETGASVTSSIVASISTTEYLTGFFGLSIIPGNFSDGQFKSPIGALVENESLIPSHSYGFTAGAIYRKYEFTFRFPLSEERSHCIQLWRVITTDWIDLLVYIYHGLTQSYSQGTSVLG